MTPGSVLDQLLDYTRDSPAGEFARNLGREIRENPVPLVLIGIGIAWLMLAASRTSGTAIASAADSVAKTVNDIGTGMSAAVSRTSEWGQQAVARISDRASNAAKIISDRTAQLAAHARDAADSLTGKARAAATSERPLRDADIGKATPGAGACAVKTAHEPR